MSFSVTCYTLFDVAYTGIINRSRPSVDEDPDVWLHKRNAQCNFDTILQVISLRSQPEVIRFPEPMKINFKEFDNFGFLFEQIDDEDYPCWSFDFEIQHPSVFYDGISDLGSLYSDCDGVPMIKCGTEWDKLPSFLDTSDELRNIYFKVIDNG